MNELMIVFEGGWMYFKTNQQNASEAFTEFTEVCDANGINIDNMTVTEVSLRKEEG